MASTKLRLVNGDLIITVPREQLDNLQYHLTERLECVLETATNRFRVVFLDPPQLVGPRAAALLSRPPPSAI